MPLVNQNQVGAFSVPVNGTTNNASDVLTNDNALRTGFNTHDADATIHIQSSVLASRPAAGTAGRFWVTTDSDVPRLWYDNGTSWAEVDYLNKTQGGTVAGNVNFTGNVTKGGSATAGTFLRGDGTTFGVSTLTIPNTLADKAMLYASSANVLAELAIGTEGQVLKVSSGAPAWGDPATATFVVDGWQHDNIAASSTVTPLRWGSTAHANDWYAGRAGSVTAVTARLTGTISAGTITVKTVKNSSADLLTVSFTSADGTNPVKTATASAGTHTFVAGDRIRIDVTGDASLSPATIDLIFASIELRYS